MATTRVARVSLLAVAVVVGLFATAAPAQAGGGVRVRVAARFVAPPVVVSIAAPAPFAPYYAPYPGRCSGNGYVTPYYAPYGPVAGVVVAPTVSFVRVWVPGPRPHWATRQVVTRFHRGRW